MSQLNELLFTDAQDWRLKYWTLPVKFRDFVVSKEQLNLPTLSERQYQAIFKLIGEDPLLVFSPERKKHIGIYLLGKGSGKDYMISILCAYLFYLLLCMINPHEVFNFPTDENIDILNVAPTAFQAREVFFNKLKSRILNWKWLVKNFKVTWRGRVIRGSIGTRMEVRITDTSIECSNNVRFNSLHAEAENYEGFNVLAGILDEVSAFPEAFEEVVGGDGDIINVGKADLIYNTLRTSAVSRKLPWLLVAISFPRRADDWMINKYEESQKDPDGIMVSERGCTWDYNPAYFKEETFKFEEWDIPLSFKSDFDTDPINSKMKYCTVPPTVLNKFFYNDERTESAIDFSIVPLLDLQDDVQEWFDANGKKIKYAIKKVMSSRIVDRSKAFAVGVDLSINKDKTVVAIGHGEPCDIKSMFVTPEGNQQLTTLQTRVIIDQIIVWKPDIKKKILCSHVNVDEILESFHGLTGYSYISYDQYQSAYVLEKALRSGIVSEKHNVKDIDYLLFRNMLHAGAISYPDNKELIFEMERLIYDGKRVDHLPIFCFTGDTKVSLTDGREVSIKDLVMEQSWGKQNFVYSVDLENKKIICQPIKKAWCTGFSKIIKIILDNGEEIKCTKNHRFMLRDGTYKEAQYLTLNDSLMPLYRRDDGHGYEKLLNVFTNKYVYTHNYRNGKSVGKTKKLVINHKIISIEDCGYDYVYDLEIPETHNFALSAGIFVHNSKDISDAVCHVVRAIAGGYARANDIMAFTFADEVMFDPNAATEPLQGFPKLPPEALINTGKEITPGEFGLFW